MTSYLMMGALSPGLKRHSVTLFEGEPLGCGVQRLLCVKPLYLVLLLAC